MFGYIKPVSAELRVKEYELYRALYCGLCEALGKNVTCSSRLSLSYDFVFLALVRMSLAKETGKIERHRCLAHPTKKRAVVVDSKELDYAARLSAVLTYYKLRDDIADSRGFKRFGAILLLPSASRMRKKAGFNKDAEAKIAAKLSELTRLESERCSSVDRVAEPFGELLAYACAYGFDESSKEAKIAAEIGRSVGRFIYIIDALDDFENDVKSGSYNAFALIYENRADKLLEDAEAIRLSLTMELTRIDAAVGLMDLDAVPEYGEIIKNIIYLGLTECRDRVLSKYTSENKPTNDNGEQKYDGSL